MENLQIHFTYNKSRHRRSINLARIKQERQRTRGRIDGARTGGAYGERQEEEERRREGRYIDGEWRERGR
jgi:hypothetical protein